MGQCERVRYKVVLSICIYVYILKFGYLLRLHPHSNVKFYSLFLLFPLIVMPHLSWNKKMWVTIYT
ncbi:hypothetical protein J3Q64DRAFT_1719073 [Phycomyces blakesleeanus]|uniref:Uncharacterized protein n=1 Tax=Phycomyces blakesleeanus TaxID=4837 RepID=A0ABR3BBG7_PHYBL